MSSVSQNHVMDGALFKVDERVKPGELVKISYVVIKNDSRIKSKKRIIHKPYYRRERF